MTLMTPPHLYIKDNGNLFVGIMSLPPLMADVCDRCITKSNPHDKSDAAVPPELRISSNVSPIAASGEPSDRLCPVCRGLFLSWSFKNL